MAGYFIESAINHYTLTTARTCASTTRPRSWPTAGARISARARKPWFDGHQEMEQALVRFGRFVNDTEGHGRGSDYIKLAKFLLDSRKAARNMTRATCRPPANMRRWGMRCARRISTPAWRTSRRRRMIRITRARCCPSGTTWSTRNITSPAALGAGETSEGFGPNYSLPNDAYCESCSSCGLIFFQYKLNLAYHDAKYADLYEETMYNALLGAVDLEGKNFCYTNPLINTDRTPWHVCPCCVSNISRTLLMVPTWTYVKNNQGLYVNLFVGSRIHVENIAGTNVEVVQKTDYPWNGAVSIIVNPQESKRFSVYVRIPNRSTSQLYPATPSVEGLKRFSVNGEEMKPKIEKGYAVVTREWKAGDRIELELPMEPQRIKASSEIKADEERVALRYGPLIYNVEHADQASLDQPLGTDTLQAEWRPDLLGGVMAITGKWADGTPMLAVPNYARMNRLTLLIQAGIGPSCPWFG